MTEETFVFFAGTYQDVSAAAADYERVRDLYDGFDLMDTFDSVVLGRMATGKVRIYQKSKQPTCHGGWVGAGWGLATGLAVALFPAIGIGATGWTTVVGAGLGTIAGHVVGGMSRSDLKELGEHLDNGDAALIVAAATAAADGAELAMSQAGRVVGKQGRVDTERLRAELDDTKLAVDATS